MPYILQECPSNCCQAVTKLSQAIPSGLHGHNMVTRYFELAPLILLQWLECLIMLCCNWGPVWSYYRCGSLIHREGYKLIKLSNNGFGSPWEGMSGQFWVRGREEGRFEEKGGPGVAKVAALSQLMDNILVRCQFFGEPFNSDFHQKSC